MIRSDLAFSLVAGVLLIMLVLLPRWLWRRGKSTPAATKPPRRTREPKPLAGLTRKPECEACDQHVQSQPQIPGASPPPYDRDPRPSPPGRYHRPLLPACRVFVSRPGRLRESPRQRPSQWTAMAPTRLSRLPWVFPGNTGHPVSRQAG